MYGLMNPVDVLMAFAFVFAQKLGTFAYGFFFVFIFASMRGDCLL